MRPQWDDRISADKAKPKAEYDSLNDPALGRHWGVQVHRQRRGKSVSSSNYLQELLKLGSPYFVECSGTYKTKPVLHPESRPSTTATQESCASDLEGIAAGVSVGGTDRDSDAGLSSGRPASIISIDTRPSPFEDVSQSSNRSVRSGRSLSEQLGRRPKERDLATCRIEVCKTKVNSIAVQKSELDRQELWDVERKRKTLEEAERQYLAAIRVGKRELQLSTKEVKEELRQKRLQAERAAAELQNHLSAQPRPRRKPENRKSEELRALETRLRHVHKKSRQIMEKVGGIRREMSETERAALQTRSGAPPSPEPELGGGMQEGRVLRGVDDLRFVCATLQRGSLRELSEGLDQFGGFGQEMAETAEDDEDVDGESESGLSERGSSASSGTVLVSSPSQSRSLSWLSRNRSGGDAMCQDGEGQDDVVLDRGGFWQVFTFVGLDRHITKQAAMRLFLARSRPCPPSDDRLDGVPNDDDDSQPSSVQSSMHGDGGGRLEPGAADGTPCISFKQLCQCMVLGAEAAELEHVGGIRLQQLRLAAGERPLGSRRRPRAASTSQRQRPTQHRARARTAADPPRAATCPPGMSRPGESSLMEAAGADAKAWGGDSVRRVQQSRGSTANIGQQIKHDVEDGVVQKELWKLLKMSGLLDAETEEQKLADKKAVPTDIETEIPSMSGVLEATGDWASNRLPDMKRGLSRALLDDANMAMADTPFQAPYSWHLRKLFLQRGRQQSEQSLSPPLLQAPVNRSSHRRASITRRRDSGSPSMPRTGSGDSQTSM